MKKLIWFTITAFAAALLATFVIFCYYNQNLGAISHKTKDWGAFGSMLAGCFTMISAFAASGTLIFLVYEKYLQNEQEKELEEQKNIRFISDTFQTIEKSYADGFFFTKKIQLSKKIAPPFNKTNPLLSELVSTYTNLLTLLEIQKTDDKECAKNVISEYYSIVNKLGLRFTKKTTGILTAHRAPINFNIFTPYESILFLYELLNEIFSFATNERISKPDIGVDLSEYTLHWAKLYTMERDYTYAIRDPFNRITKLVEVIEYLEKVEERTKFTELALNKFITFLTNRTQPMLIEQDTCWNNLLFEISLFAKRHTSPKNVEHYSRICLTLKLQQ